VNSRTGALALLGFFILAGAVVAPIERAMGDSLIPFCVGVVVVSVVALISRRIHPFGAVWWFCLGNAPVYIFLYYR